MHLRLSLAATLLILSVPVTAGDRPAWSMSNEERLALRFDEHASAERVQAHVSAMALDAARPQFVIDGARNPELFLPGELMSFLLAGYAGDSESIEAARRKHAGTLQELEWSAGRFWADLNLAASEYRQLTRQGSTSRRSDAASRRICSARISALKRMREKYERFDEFLYRAIAAETVIASDRPATRDWVLWLERGCD